MSDLSDDAVVPLATLDPAAPLDDLGWLDEVVGDARVVAIGESSHYNREFLQLRHRLTRHLVERHGFDTVAMETGFVEGWQIDSWVRGGNGELGQVMASGLTSLMGLWAETRALLEWMREHNRAAIHPVGFYGIDLGGSNVSLLPGLDAVTVYLAQADPEFRIDHGIRETAAVFSAGSAFGIPAAMAGYPGLAAERRDALTAGLADLRARVTSRRLDYVRRTGADAYERALRSLDLTVTVDALFRELARGGPYAMIRDYVVIGTTSGTGQTLSEGPDFFDGKLFAEMGPPEPGSLDALMAASHDGPFAVDMRRLAPDDAARVRAASRQRFGSFYTEQNSLDAYDVLVHLPEVTAAQLDAAAAAASPEEVRQRVSARPVSSSQGPRGL